MKTTALTEKNATHYNITLIFVLDLDFQVTIQNKENWKH